MSLNLTKSTFHLDAAVGAASSQAICRTTLSLPEDKADIGRILAAKADVKLDSSSVKVAEDKVIVQGQVVLEVPYVAAYNTADYAGDREPISFFVSDSATFQAELEVPGAASDMTALIDAEVDSFEVDASGPRTIALTAILKVAAKIVSRKKVELTSDVSDYDSEKVKVDKKTLFLESKVGENVSYLTIREAFQVPEGKADIGELLDYTAAVFVPSDGLRPASNKVLANGTLDLRVVYVGDTEERPVQFLAGPQIDFQTAVDLAGASEGTRVKGQGFVESLTLTKVGSRTIQVEASVGVKTSAAVINELTAIVDLAASGEDVIDVQKTGLKLESLVGQVSSPATVSETFAVGNGKPDIDEVLMTSAKARITDAKLVPDKVLLTGEVDIYVTYAGIPGEPGDIAAIDTVQQLGLPFELSLDVAGVEAGMGTFATAEVIDAEAIVAGPRTLDVNVKVNAVAKVTEDLDIDVVTDAAVISALPQDALPSRRLTIYVVQQGDTLWKVARRYGRATARIAEVNKLALDGLTPGQKLLIPN